MTWWEAALLGLVQGLTEFLPVSSSGHLVLGQYLLGLDAEADVTFEVLVHFGTVLSILTVYWRRVLRLITAVFKGLARPVQAYAEDDDVRMAAHILITLVPTGLVYVLLREQLEAAFGSPKLVCGMLIVTGILLLLTLLRRDPSGRITPLKALLVGLAQAAAMIPGISRSGSTICTALYQNVTPSDAADFSFLMLLPVVLGATLLKVLDLTEQASSVDTVGLAIGTLVAYVSGVLAIRVMLDFVKKGRLQYFAYYCFAVGGLGLALLP
ncbi:MAG: undecaprenyl-diphosphate phosphatase [Bacteroidota bacterium]